MLGDILLPNVALEHSGSYFHSKLEWASEAIIANATYFGNAQWAQEYLDYTTEIRTSRAGGSPQAGTGPAKWSSCGYIGQPGMASTRPSTSSHGV
jgi:hypothetical protein